MNDLSDRLIRLLYLGIACVCAFGVAGCEEDVTAVTGTDRAFSLYGVLQPQADTQFISVYPISDQLRRTTPEPLDAEITLTDLTTDETHHLRDSVKVQEDGDYAHFFWAPLRAQHDHTYRIEARNDRDQVSSVELTVPPAGTLAVQDPRQKLSVGVVNPVHVTSDAPRLVHVEVEYLFKYGSGPPESTQARATLPYDDRVRRLDEGGWVIDINLTRDHETLRDRLQNRGVFSYEYGIAMLQMTLRLSVVTEEWNPPGNSFDPEVLVQPGTMSNVENGFGFVGAGFKLERTWLPDSRYLDQAGWTIL